MDPGSVDDRLRARRARWNRAGGFTTVQYVMVVGLSFVFLLMIANLIVFQYGRGVVREALDSGARAGATADGNAADCEARADDALRGLIGASMRAGVSLRCDVRGDTVVATADVHFASWLPAFVPDWTFHSEATVVKEHAP